MITIEIKGLDDLQKRLGRSIEPELQQFTLAIASELQGEIAPYPPATEANRPVSRWVSKGRNQWYERGFGSRWIRKNGTFGARKSSQMMGRQWAVNKHGRFGARVGNQASYALYLHNYAEQVPWAKARHWKTDKQAAEAVVRGGAIQRLWQQMVRKWWG